MSYSPERRDPGNKNLKHKTSESNRYRTKLLVKLIKNFIRKF